MRMHKSVHSILARLLVFFLMGCSHGKKVRFYASPDYFGGFHEMDTKPGCNSLPRYARGRAVSIETESCIMVYDSGDCGGYSRKITPSGLDAIGKDLSKIYKGTFNKKTKSVRDCDETEGGDKINVDVYAFVPILPGFSPWLAAEYKNVCGCTRIPVDLVGQVAKMDNHGNCLQIFSLDNCAGYNFTLPAGKHKAYEKLYNSKFTNNNQILSRLRSFKPCEVPPGCFRLAASVFQFEISLSFNESNIGRTELEQTTFFRNNGTAKLTKEYMVKGSVTETYETQESTSHTIIESISAENTFTTGISNSLEISSSAKIFGIGADIKNTLKLSFETAIKKAYSSQKQNTQQNSFMHSTSNSKEFSISEQIEIPECTEYKVSSIVKLLKDATIDYMVYSKLSGNFSGRRLSAQELKRRISGFTYTYIRDYDEWTIEVKHTGVMTVTLGIEAVMEGHGFTIEGCVKANADTLWKNRVIYITIISVVAILIVVPIVYYWRRKYTTKSYKGPDASKNFVQEMTATHYFKERQQENN